ncbi:TP53BP1 [Acanthosepion pharaonis]|uniref:TP53BP1 n=1 Tax=Acanthosepion pharaonis TaxID=158019 RepID=A0A812BWU9_ACAPH|nr:TP53BP1 [Sepia pharaonis]
MCLKMGWRIYSQDTENIPPLWNDASILKSLPALQIPETQYDFELTSIPDTPLSPVHNFNLSKVHLFDSELDDSCSLNLNPKRKIMDDQNKVIDETCSQGSSTSDSSGNFGKSLNQSMIENPKFYEKPNSPESSKNISEKVLSVKEYKDSSDTKTKKDIPSTSFSEKMTKEKNVTVLARQSLFKNYQEDTESDEKEPNPVVCTPSTHIGSLQFSQESMFVPDTADEMNYIEPSPEYNPTPTIIPDSPTAGMSEDSDDDTQDPTIIETTIVKQKESENLDITVEPVVEDSVKESQSFQLLYLATQPSQMSQVEKCVSSEKHVVGEEPKKETELSHHDNSSNVSESEDLNLHLSFNTQTESCKDAASQRSSFSGKMSISQSPATPKDNSSDEVKFKLILPSSAHSPSQISKDETHFERSSSTSVKSKPSSQQDVSQGILSAQYKMKSEEKLTDPKTLQSQEDRWLGSQKKDSPVESQKVYSQNVACSSQKRDSHDESQKGYSQNVACSSQKKDSPDESQKGYSQNIPCSSQKRDSPDESQKGYFQNVACSSQKRNSPDESQKGYLQNVSHSSQKRDSPDESQKGYSQNMPCSSQKRDSPDESQKGYSQNVAHSSQKRDSPDESQKGYSQDVAHSSQKRDSPDEPQKGYSQDVAHSSQKRDSSDESQKGYSQNMPCSQKNDASASQEKNSYLQAGSQSHIIPHVSDEKKELGLSFGSQGTKSQSAISRDDSQSRISVVDSANALVTEINTTSPDRDKKSIKSSCQQLSHSQPSKQSISGSYNTNLQDMKQWTCSLDSGLPQLTNVEPFASSLKRQSPTDKATTDPARISSLVTASPEKMEIDFAAIELPTKPNICYLKDTEHSQGSSTISLSQNHQFEIYSSQMGISQELNKNSKEVSSLSTHTACDKNLVSSPHQESTKNILATAIKKLTLIKPRCKEGRSELPEASSTIYPSQTSASQQRHTPSVEMQPQQRITSANVARYNINSVQTNPKTEQPLAGPSNDPYLFIESQPKTAQIVESKKKQRRSKGLSKFTQKRMQKKSIPKKKSSLSGRSWTIRKDYKSPVHRVRFEPLRRRTATVKLLKDDPIFLKVPSYKDIETIFSRKDSLKEQIKSSCSSDGSTQKSTNKDDPQHQTLFSNLQNVLQRKIVEETVVQLVYRKITIETVKNSKVVDSRTIVEKDDPLIIQRSRNEDFKYLNSAKGVSPFCSPNSLTSGEYADVSSLSHSDSKTSNSSSFGSLATKTSTFEVPMSPLVQISSSQSKKDNLSGPQSGQPVTLRSLQSPNTDDDLLKAPSPITSVYKDTHSVYCSTEELHAVNQNCEGCRSYVTETVPALEASSGDPAKSRATVVQNSDSLFSSAENLNISDSGPSTTIAGQENVKGKEGQRSVDSLVQEADQSITLTVESAEISEIDLKTPPASQKWSSPQKRKASHSDEISEETGIDKPPPQKRLRKDSEEGTSLQQTKTSEEAGSPEITLQDYQPIKMPSLSPESSKKDKSEIGMKVMAKWKDGYFYPGKTASKEKGGKCLINFADGDQLWVKINQILVVDYLPQGQSVMVQSKDNFFDSAMIVDHISISSDSSDSFVYQVEMDDNTTVNCARQKVILSEDQAAILLSDEEYQMTSAAPSTPRLSGADVSLDNLVEGSRRSAKKVEVLSEKMESRSSKRTKLMRMEPQAMSTPTPKRKAKALKKDSKDAESLIGAAVSSPKSQKSDRTRQVKKELFDAVKGPIPKQKNLFKGMNFLLTYTEKSTEQKLLDKKMIQEFSSESSTNISYSDIDEPEIPFDKQHLQSQIEAGGGTIFDSWSDKFISKKTKSFIISNSYQRTIKYLQGLAAGIPCVSYLWIRDCCKQGISSDYKAYMLQAGISLKKKSLIECKLKPQCLDDTQVLVFSTHPDFVSTWSEILTLAGCNVVKKFKRSRDFGSIVC